MQDAIIEALNTGLCGTASDFRVRIRFANGIHASTPVVAAALADLHKKGAVKATRFGTDHAVHYSID